jgi:hypothetical protein
MGVQRDIEGHTNHSVFIDVYDFVQENEKLKTDPEANALIH